MRRSAPRSTRPATTSKRSRRHDARVTHDERDPAYIERVRPVLETYVRWFRPEVRGFENVPAGGPFLVVGNHSGGATPPDIPVLMTAWWRARGVDEPVYGMFHSAFLGIPGVGPVV